jgi:hypothetical protein
MDYELHGAGGIPLLLLDGGLFNIDLQFGRLLPGLAATRQVIAADFQGTDGPVTSTGRSPAPTWPPTWWACSGSSTPGSVAGPTPTSRGSPRRR